MLSCTTRRIGRKALSVRHFCATETEKNIRAILSSQLQATNVKVVDTSGGCGAMYDITIESPLFKDKSRISQHKMVTNVLKAEIKEMHGLTIKTAVSP